MAGGDTLTTHYSWVMPQDQSSSNTWGVKLNADLQAIDTQVWTNAQASQNVTVLRTASVAATYSFGNSLVPSAQQLRWQWAMDTTAESGSNAGSNLSLKSYSDTGTLVASPITVNRATGAFTFTGASTFNGVTTFNGASTFTQLTTPFLTTLNTTPGALYTAINFMAVPGLQAPTDPVQPAASVGSIQAQYGPDIGYGSGILTVNSNVITLMSQGGTTLFGPSNGNTRLDFKNGTNLSPFATLRLAVRSGGGSYDFFMDATNGFNLTHALAVKPGGGAWAATSDARIKTVEGSYMSGLAAVLALRPVEYRYKNDPATLRVGLVAQEVEDVMPEMVTKGEGEIDGEKVSDLRTLDTTALVFALVNAVKELTAEIDELKAKST